ncbi:ExeM/NucH family extracellular endonuclease [Saccharospirillum salsuginis]|uniref:Endonuclease/exonuclease/phosphatase domain-containing protein n=1 Tax=Saccharospirillum salsuginis TaxID=418750 RepID=A0A918K0G4_9GAMM|nr:ExeM/NucH family extracellular endonuclease [Saccharospirillum salsuginis]GGX39732.1 hypothetical protein GCM10007392_02810 [Saccharospirillum salsuginis]
MTMRNACLTKLALAVAAVSAAGQVHAAVACGDTSTPISEIQGSGSSTPKAGETVTVEGIVTADLQDGSKLNGFFIQSTDDDADADPMTSEGLFIYAQTPDVAEGDAVIISGEAKEHYGHTQVSATAIEICSSDNQLPSPASVSLPLDSEDTLETLEGMRIQLDQTLTANDVRELARFGAFWVSNGRRFQPTEVALPGSDEAQSIATTNELNRLLVDDGNDSQNPEPVVYPNGNLSAHNSLRNGETLSGLTGVVYYTWSQYRLFPTEPLQYGGTNPRTTAPETSIDGNLRVASFNVLNYFNGDGEGGGFPTARGADDAEELERQKDKLIAALEALDADVIGLMEIENDGFDELSAIAQLVDALNATQSESDQYAFVDPGVATIGDDDIAVGLIYRPTQVSPVNTAKILSSNNSPLDDSDAPLFNDDKNRPALAQSFEDAGTGDRFTVVVNHLKSKGSSCEDLGDPEDPNGQGNCNQIRTNAAQALSQWLDTDPTGVDDDDILIIGDLNAYSMEDPIRALSDAGYDSLKAEGEYSYVYDGMSGNLDHALANDSLANKAVLVQDWHINTDEPSALDYNLEYKSDAQDVSFYAATPFRSSDHDPVIVDFKMVADDDDSDDGSDSNDDSNDSNTDGNDKDDKDDRGPFGGAFMPVGGLPGALVGILMVVGLVRLRGNR